MCQHTHISNLPYLNAKEGSVKIMKLLIRFPRTDSKKSVLQIYVLFKKQTLLSAKNNNKNVEQYWIIFAPFSLRKYL